MKKKIATPAAETGYGWVLPKMAGREDQTIRHSRLPYYLGPKDNAYEPDLPEYIAIDARKNNGRLHLCKITVEPQFDSLGRPITRKV